MTEPVKMQSSIVQQIIDGSITIDSIGEFQSMLKIFPGNPHLQRALADLLVKRKSTAAAAEYFKKAARLFVESGHILQAVVAKMLQWQIVKPSFKSIKTFYHSLIENNPRSTPLNMFFAGLSFREFIVLVTRLERIVLPAGKMVQKFGDPENTLFMVVSGRLHRRLYPSTRSDEDQNLVIESIEEDIFGEVYPLDKERYSQSYTETATRVELAKISRESLLQISTEFPSVGTAVRELFANCRRLAPSPFVERKMRRHAISVQISLNVLEDDGTTPLANLYGFTRDLSIGGACLVLDESSQTPPSHLLIGKTVNIMMSPPNDAMTINIKGSIVWSQTISNSAQNSQAIGIEFNSMPPHLSGLLLVFADNLYHAH
jgi:CRP-like cAMP-binding protein